MAHNTSFVGTLDYAVACDFEGFVAAQRALRLGLEKFFGEHGVKQERDRVQVLGRALFALATETGTVRIERAFTGVRTLDQLLRLGAAMIAAKIRGTGEQMEHLAPHFDRALQAALTDHDAQRNCDQTVLLAEAAEEESSPDPADPEAQEYGRQVRDLAAEMFAQEQAAEIRQLRAQSEQYSDRIRRLESADAEATSRRLEEFIAWADQRIGQIPDATASLEQVAAEIAASKKLQRELAAQLRAAPQSATEVARRIGDETKAFQQRLDDAVARAQRAADEQQARAEQRFAQLEQQLYDGLAAAQQANDPRRLFSEQRDDLEQQMRSLRDQYAGEMAALKRQLGSQTARGDPAREQAILAEVDGRIAVIERSIRQATLHASPETKRRIDESEARSQMTNADVMNLQRMMQRMTESMEQHQRAIDDIRRQQFSASPFRAPAGSASPAQEEGAAVAMLRQQRREQSELAASSGPLMAAWLDDDELLQRQLAQLPRYTWKKSPLKAGVGCPWPQLLRAVATEFQKQSDDGDNWRDAALKRLQTALDRKNRGTDKPFALSVGQLEWLEMAAADRAAPWHFAELCGVWALAPVKEWDAKLGMLRIARRLPHAWTASERAQHASGTLLLPLPVSGGSVTFETKQ